MVVVALYLFLHSPSLVWEKLHKQLYAITKSVSFLNLSRCFYDFLLLFLLFFLLDNLLADLMSISSSAHTGLFSCVRQCCWKQLKVTVTQAHASFNCRDTRVEPKNKNMEMIPYILFILVADS